MYTVKSISVDPSGTLALKCNLRGGKHGFPVIHATIKGPFPTIAMPLWVAAIGQRLHVSGITITSDCKAVFHSQKPILVIFPSA